MELQNLPARGGFSQNSRVQGPRTFVTKALGSDRFNSSPSMFSLLFPSLSAAEIPKQDGGSELG